MNRIRLADSGILLALGLAFATWTSVVQAGVCNEVQTLFQAAESDRVDNDFFDSYYIARKKGVYKVYVSKRVELELVSIAAVMNNLEVFDKFMPGYKDILVRRNPDGEILTAIEFSPSFSPFDSRFTNEVEISESATEYQQCWRQLDSKDNRVTEEFENAPDTNSGFWYIVKISDRSVEITYFSAIKPPVRIPGIVYKWILRNSYKGAFEALIRRAANVTPP
jgi:hypothetical protein